MASMASLNDHQNMALTQFSYCTAFLEGKEGTFGEIAANLYKQREERGLNPEEEQFLELMEEFNSGNAEGDFSNNPFCNYRLKEVIDTHETGFGAIVFEDEYGNTGFSYRGSDPFWDKKGNNQSDFLDWLDNVLAAVTGTSLQNKQACDFFDAYAPKDGDIYLYGHSKGGQLSEMVFIENHERIKEVHLLNPQPINPFVLSLEELAALRSGKMDIVMIEGDYVWCLGLVSNKNRIRIGKCKDGGNPHSYGSLLYNDDGGIQAGKLTLVEWGYTTLESALVTTFQSSFFVITYAAARLYDFQKNVLTPMVDKFLKDFRDLLETAYQMGKDLVDTVMGYLESVASRAKDWYNRNFNAGWSYAQANPVVQVNTQALRTHAEKLKTLNTRLRNLDRRLDTLYGRVGLFDLLELIRADLLTGYSWRLSRCSDYLLDTAADFENTESAIMNQL